MRNMTRISLMAIGLGGLSLASLAVAQGPASALKGHNSDAPIDVAADRIEAQDRADRAIFSGNVRVKQAALTLDTQRLTVAYSSSGGVQIRRLDASGGVLVRSPSETARGNFGIYDLDTQMVEVNGPVRVAGADGYRLATSNVRVDMKQRTLASQGRVSGAMPLGQFEAGQMRADLGTRTVVLDGGVRLKIVQGAVR